MTGPLADGDRRDRTDKHERSSQHEATPADGLRPGRLSASRASSKLLSPLTSRRRHRAQGYLWQYLLVVRYVNGQGPGCVRFWLRGSPER
jgi:hypothetical protein